ncbi:MAG: c-type cytochrome [Gemmatimonadaceae bacterium]
MRPTSSGIPILAAVLAAVASLGACGREGPVPDSPGVAQQAATGIVFDPATWTPPDTAAIPADSLGASIRRGLALVLDTTDSLPAYAPGNITCGNCHRDAGRNPDAAPLTGSHARFPKYMDRTGAVIGLADRVNYCFTRSLAGTRIPIDSREMQDILAYIAWLSTNVPHGHGKDLPGASGIAELPEKLQGDSARGATIFTAKCAACHGQDGQGQPAAKIPALWGPKSYSVGASMARVGKAASFIWHNMPNGAPKSLTKQEAFDLAVYVNSQPRIDSPGKENDWPVGGAPADVPYATAGHAAYDPPPLLARANPGGAIVPKPAPIARTLGTKGGK